MLCPTCVRALPLHCQSVLGSWFRALQPAHVAHLRRLGKHVSEMLKEGAQDGGGAKQKRKHVVGGLGRSWSLARTQRLRGALSVARARRPLSGSESSTCGCPHVERLRRAARRGPVTTYRLGRSTMLRKLLGKDGVARPRRERRLRIGRKPLIPPAGLAAERDDRAGLRREELLCTHAIKRRGQGGGRARRLPDTLRAPGPDVFCAVEVALLAAAPLWASDAAAALPVHRAHSGRARAGTNYVCMLR